MVVGNKVGGLRVMLTTTEVESTAAVVKTSSG